MLQTGDTEKEFLLGNKQILVVFFIVAALLGVAFTGGYMLGRGSISKTTQIAGTGPSSPSADPSAAHANAPSAGGETHSVSPTEDLAGSGSVHSAANESHSVKGNRGTGSTPLRTSPQIETVADAKYGSFSPQSGQEFLQITAVKRDHAGKVAAALRKHGFHAYAVPKPGDTKLYRVLVGPIRNAGELASTRDSLRKTGFSNVIVQRYE